MDTCATAARQKRQDINLPGPLIVQPVIAACMCDVNNNNCIGSMSEHIELNDTICVCIYNADDYSGMVGGVFCIKFWKWVVSVHSHFNPLVGYV